MLGFPAAAIAAVGVVAGDQNPAYATDNKGKFVITTGEGSPEV